MKFKFNKSIILYILSAVIASTISIFLLYNLDLLSRIEKDIILICFVVVFITAIISTLNQKTSLSRLTFTLIMFALFFSVLFFILEKSGFWENINTIESLQQFIKERGIFSSLVFVVIQISQVVLIPIPGVVTVSVGNIMFGFVWGSLLSYAGIIIGSVMAFIIGRKFGYKLVVWIAGENNVKKVLDMIKGKDKVVFTMIFLLPFFPDDILCFIAGLTSMSLFFFTGMALATRIVTIVATALFTELVKYLLISQTIFGYIILFIISAILLLIFIITLKHGEKIQTYFEKIYCKIFKKKIKSN